MIAKEIVPDKCRSDHVAKIFVLRFPFTLESVIYTIAGRLSDDYLGGYWQFFALSNGSFFMAPDSDSKFEVISENGYHGIMSAEAFGITVCMYAYSQLSFGNDDLARECANQFHLLRDYIFDHPETKAILAAID